MAITLIGSKNGVYVDPTNCKAYVDYRQATNYKDVDMADVNSLVIRREDNGGMKIIQAGGYSMDRGLFVDMY